MQDLWYFVCGEHCWFTEESSEWPHVKLFDALKESVTDSLVASVHNEQIVGAHLVNDHQLKYRSDFNKSYKIFILALCDPSYLRIEQSWIDRQT